MTRSAGLAAVLLAAMAALAVPALRRYRPQQIPAGLAEGITMLEADGWTVRSWHALLCRDSLAGDPHAHLISPGGMTVVAYASGRVRLPHGVPAL